MYPFVRLIKDMVLARRAPELPILGVHVSHHRCWPQDIDVFIEMNNGRILTILDLGRTVLAFTRSGTCSFWVAPRATSVSTTP